MSNDTWPSQVLKDGPTLGIADSELAWIGAAAAYWSLGEQNLEHLIWFFGPPPEFNKNVVNFSSKIEMGKKGIKRHLSMDADGKEIGRQLMILGGRLSETRKRFAHWIVSGHPNGLQFADPHVRHAPDPRTAIMSIAEVQSFVRITREWAFDLNKLPYRTQSDPPAWLEFNSIKMGRVL